MKIAPTFQVNLVVIRIGADHLVNHLFRRREILLLARSPKKGRKPPEGLDLLGCVVGDRDPIRFHGVLVIAGGFLAPTQKKAKTRRPDSLGVRELAILIDFQKELQMRPSELGR